jgi:chromosome segregation ATPase
MKNNTKSIIGLAAVLLLFAIGWGIYQSFAKQEKVRTIKMLDTKVVSLENQRDSMKIRVDSLEKIYAQVSKDYVVLEDAIDKAKKEIRQKEAIIRNLKKSNSAEVDSLTRKVEEMLSSQKDLLITIEELDVEKMNLLTKMKEARKEMNSLSARLDQEMYNLDKAHFVGTSFRADIEKRNDKVTAKARRAREIKITFELNNVPERFHGIQPIYLVITDEKSTPITTNTANKAIVEINNQKVELLAQEIKEIDITKDQSIFFLYELDDKLEAGVYSATVYATVGILGSVSFQLR